MRYYNNYYVITSKCKNQLNFIHICAFCLKTTKTSTIYIHFDIAFLNKVMYDICKNLSLKTVIIDRQNFTLINCIIILKKAFIFSAIFPVAYSREDIPLSCHKTLGCGHGERCAPAHGQRHIQSLQ